MGELHREVGSRPSERKRARVVTESLLRLRHEFVRDCEISSCHRFTQVAEFLGEARNELAFLRQGSGGEVDLSRIDGGRVAELAYAVDLKSTPERVEGSNPSPPTTCAGYSRLSLTLKYV